MTDEMKHNKISWKRIAIFFFIATLISNIFRFDIFEFNLVLEKLPTWIFILTTALLEGSGVIIGALIIIPFLKKQRNIEMSLFGTSKSKSLLMAIIPIILLTIIGVKNDFGMNFYIYGFISGIATLLYCVMEEYGWRGYLQEELKTLKPYQKFLTIGIIWYLWHLTFLTKASFGDNLFFLGMLIFGSWGIGQVAELTKSIIASACFHMIIQIMLFNSLIKNGIDGIVKIIILGVSVVIWFVIMKRWEKQSKLS
jgi:hypothetical protein